MAHMCVHDFLSVHHTSAAKYSDIYGDHLVKKYRSFTGSAG